METDSAKRLYAVLRRLTAFAVLLMTLVFITECLGIFFTNASPMYSVEKVSQALRRARWFVLALILLITATSLTARTLSGNRAETKTKPSDKLLPADRTVNTVSLIRSKKSNKKRIAARAAIFLLAIAFIVYGIFNGSLSDVLKKAIAICTECIGLG